MKIKTLFIFLPILIATACSSVQKEKIRLSCDFERNGDIVTIAITNNSNKDIHIVTQFKPGQEQWAYFFTGKIVDNNGIIITQNPRTTNGHWAWYFKLSSFHVTPFITKKIESGKSIKGEFKLSKLFQFLGDYSKYRPTDSFGRVEILPTDSVTLRGKFYLDENASRSITFESDPMGEHQKSTGRVVKESRIRKGKMKIKKPETGSGNMSGRVENRE